MQRNTLSCPVEPDELPKTVYVGCAYIKTDDHANSSIDTNKQFFCQPGKELCKQSQRVQGKNVLLEQRKSAALRQIHCPQTVMWSPLRPSKDYPSWRGKLIAATSQPSCKYKQKFFAFREAHDFQPEA